MSVCPLTIKQSSVKFHIPHLHRASLSVPIIGKEGPKSFGLKFVPDEGTNLVQVKSIHVAGKQSGHVGPRVQADFVVHEEFDGVEFLEEKLTSSRQMTNRVLSRNRVQREEEDVEGS